MSHTNNGKCAKCQAIFDVYPGFYQPLRDWFTNMQYFNPSAHISCAGRGKVDQETYFQRGASRAHYGQSSHNYNAAIDIFHLNLTGQAEWPKDWFQKVVGSNLTPDLKWYGAPGAVFYELPHVEVAGWKSLVQSGTLKLVE